MDRLPLVPTEFTNVEEALQNFTVVFESRYGGLHPRFHAISLRSALDEAFGGGSLSTAAIDQRPIAIYLHHDNAIACNIFAQQVICSEAIVSLLNCQFVVWPWDQTQSDNQNKLNEWLVENNLNELKNALRFMDKDDYPLLYVISKDRTSYEIETPIRGSDDADKAMEQLLASLDNFQSIKNRILAEEQHRVEREQIRQEQVSAYEESLAIDRAKQEEAARQRQQEIEEQAKEVEIQEAREQRCAVLASTLPAEPDATAADVIAIRVRVPSGEQRTRRFEMGAPISVLLQYIESLGYDIAEHRVFTSDIPRKDVTTLPSSRTFAELKWTRREAITVDAK